MKKKLNDAFTLIELLASMAILSLIILVISSLYDAATKTWVIGESQVTLYNLGRSAVDQIYIDMTTAVADDYLPLLSAQPRAGSYRESGGLYMVSAVTHRAPAAKRSDFQEICYFVEDEDGDGRGHLRRRRHSISQDGYAANRYNSDSYTPWGEGFFSSLADTAILMENVYTMEVTAYLDGTEVPEYNSKQHAPLYFPDRIDVKITALSDHDWNRVERLQGGDLDEFVRNNGAVFRVTATFPSRGR